MFNHPNYLKAKSKEWFKISAKESKEGELVGHIEILDAIDEYFSQPTPAELISQIRAMKVDRIHVAINSPGGSVFSGLGIYNALKSHPAKVTTEVLGLAASISSIIAMAGDNILMHENSMMMIHKAIALTYANAQEMRDMASTLEKIDGQLISIYAEKTKIDPIIIEDMMVKETWLTSAEAVELNFAAILEHETAQIKSAFDLSIYKNTPDILKKVTNEDLLAKAKEEEDLKRASLQKEFLRRRIELAEYL